jgi:FKBP-type peptidyl-prolyl cis-trans isomerase SlyD
MTIAKDKVVSIGYVLTDDKGQVIDSSEGSEPLVYLHGNGNLIPGLEAELEGKTPGAKIEAVIPPDKAYGLRDDKLVMDFPKSSFESDAIEPGMQFEASDGNGYRVFTVLSVAKDKVKVDANHPLAGETLHFKVEIVDVREATAEELEHGHVHGGECECECGECGDECGHDAEGGEGSGGCGCGCH